MSERRHPLREPMVWLIIALPLAAVIASIWLVVLSYNGGSIDAVADDVQREALMGTFGTLGVITVIWLITGPLWVAGRGERTSA